MRIMLSRKTLFLIGALVVVPCQFYAHPVPYKKMRVFVLVPPEQILPGVKQIAVLDFQSGDNIQPGAGAKVADHLISLMLQPARGIGDVEVKTIWSSKKEEGKTLQKGAFTNIFEIIERSRLNHVMAEQSLEASELVDESKAVGLGRLLGVQAILTGTLTHRHSDEPWVKKETAKARDGSKYEVQLQCVQRIVTVSYNVRVVNAETGLVLGSSKGDNSAKEGLCATNPSTGLRELTPGLPSVQTLYNSALDGLAPRIVDYITPHFEQRELELEKITTKEFRDVAENGAKAAEDLRIDEAYALFWSIYDKDPYNPRVLYNLGLLHEVVGNHEQARDFYQMAYQLKDEGRYEDGLKRVEKALAFDEALSLAGVEILTYDFRVDREVIDAAMATEVEIKGSREDRVPVYALASEEGDVVTRVPGGITFTVIEEKGDWLCIKLLGGGQGWIQRDKVKVKG